ncbi:MAG: glycosyltransferase [Firmicutes bacterium]|jgi:glycosyltransferase involved in cell wall biosynthesis|nr:glycosyltransferase [Bacillota bacterium]
MRICILHPTLNQKGGAENVVIWLARELARRGHQVSVYTAGYSRDLWGSPPEEFDIVDMEIDGIYDVDVWQSVGDLLAPELEDYDLVNPHNYPSYIWAAAAKSRLGEKCPPVVWYCEEPPRHIHWAVTDVHGIGRYPTVAPDPRVEEMERKAVAGMDLILANSAFTARNVSLVYGREAVACPPGVPLPRKKRPPMNAESARSAIRVVSRLTPEKNLGAAIRAMRVLADRNLAPSDTPLQVVGTGHMEGALRQLVSELRLDNVEFLGYLTDDELGSFYDGARIVLYVPIDEPLGLVPLEAMAHGVPVVGSNHGGVAETVIHGMTGYLVDPCVPEEIAEQLGRLLGNEADARDFGEAGRRRIEKEYTIERFATRFMEEIETRLFDEDGCRTHGRCGSCEGGWCHALWLPEERAGKAPFSAEEWADAWSRLRGDWIVDVLGHSPLAEPGLVRALQLLDPRKKIALTTDASSEVIEFVQSIATHRCECVTLRYDPATPVNLHRLLGKALLLQKRGFPVVVNLVADLTVLWVLDDITRVVSDHGVRAHIDPWDFDAKGPPKDARADEVELMRRVVSQDRQSAFEDGPTSCTCTAGSRHLVVTGEGLVYACLTRMRNGDPPIGNLFDPGFEPLEDVISCNEKRCCLGDLDHTRKDSKG